MLIVYCLGDRKLFNAYLTKNRIQYISAKNIFLKHKMMYCKKKYINVLISLCLYILYTFFVKKKSKLNNTLNAN